MQEKQVFTVFRRYFSADSEILILGSFPSVKSREVSFTTVTNKINFGKLYRNFTAAKSKL